MARLRTNMKRLAAAAITVGGISLIAAPGAFAAANNITSNPTSGTNSTNFSLNTIGQGFSCPVPTSSANGDKLQSFVLDNSLFPVSSLLSMTWNESAKSWSSGANTGFGLLQAPNNGGAYVDQATDPVTGNFPSTSTGPFSYQWYITNNDYAPTNNGAVDLYPGTWNIGIACVTPGGAIDQTLVYLQQTVTNTSSGTNNSFTWSNAAGVAAPEFPLAIGLPIAGFSVLGVGAVVMRRRRRSDLHAA